jgi:4-hydroxythreonine-4-phosphate dehydrogenase
MGDPLGIGPEVIAKSLADGAVRSRARWVILGDSRTMANAATACSLPALWTDLPAAALASNRFVPTRPGEVVVVDIHADDQQPESSRSNARPTPAQAGAASYAYVEQAIALAKLPVDHPWHASAVVTAPISKHHWSLAGHTRFPGHTELFAHATSTPKFAMMFHAPPIEDASPNAGAEALRSPGSHPPPVSHVGLNLILATVHQPLRTVASTLTTQRIVDVITLGAQQLQRMGIESPRIGVCGLNPHAGEQGLLGDEDDRIIAPAVLQARAAGLSATGPHPADTIFQSALSRLSRGVLHAPTRFDLVVAMYHDQGLAPLKTLAWDRAVNLTVGLPFLRTSPDHGTAFDIAGKGLAHEGSMKAALLLATPQ